MVRILFPPAVSQRTIIRRRPAPAAFALLAKSRLLLVFRFVFVVLLGVEF
jgi:hypothetical protein